MPNLASVAFPAITSEPIVVDVVCLPVRVAFMPQLVQLYVYDLSRGMATVMAPQLIGRPLEGIWYAADRMGCVPWNSWFI